MIQINKNKQGGLTGIEIAIALAIAAFVAFLVWWWLESWGPSGPTTATPGPTTPSTVPPVQPPTGQPASDIYSGGQIRGSWSGPANVKNGEQQTFTFTIVGVNMAGDATEIDGAAVTFNIQPPTHVRIVSVNGYAYSGAAPTASNGNGQVVVIVEGTQDPPPYSGGIVAVFGMLPSGVTSKDFEIQADD